MGGSTAGADDKTAVDNEESLVDKLRSGDYAEIIASAQKGHEAQQAAAQLCLQKDGGVVKADPHSYAFHKGKAEKEDPNKEWDFKGKEESSYEDDLKKLREARMQQMRDEQRWRKIGHGDLRELADEREFLSAIKPHERAVVLLDDGRAVASDVLRALTRLAKKHLESQFCRLPSDKAFFLTHMVELEGLPAIFIVEEGQVTKQLSPSTLFEYSSASSPLFIKHLAKALLRVGGISNAEAGSSCSEDDEEEDTYARRKRQN